MDSQNQTQIQLAIQRGAKHYFDQCRDRVDPFVKQHFCYPGTWSTNRVALGWDLLRAPFNLFWAPFYLLAMFLAWLCRRLHWTRLTQLLAKTPSGMTTRVQKRIAELIYQDLLQHAPITSEADALQDAIVDSLDDWADNAHNQNLTRELEPVVADALAQYAITRTASSDITNSILSTALGAFAFQKFTPGGLAIGFAIAALLAKQWAVENFIFGDFLGGLWYSLFPPQPSLGLMSISTVAVLACLAVFASFSGLITDPIQSWTGIHRRRLHKLINNLEKDFLRNSLGSFRPKDHIIARMLEILDAAKSQVI